MKGTIWLNDTGLAKIDQARPALAGVSPTED